MTNKNENKNEHTNNKTKTIHIHGWAELSPNALLIQPSNRNINQIPQTDKIKALKQTVRQQGYDPDKFHITVDYIEQKSTKQTTITDTTMYTVYGWCEYGLTTSIETDANKSLEDISNEQLHEALENELRDNNIDPNDFHIELDEVLID